MKNTSWPSSTLANADAEAREKIEDETTDECTLKFDLQYQEGRGKWRAYSITPY